MTFPGTAGSGYRRCFLRFQTAAFDNIASYEILSYSGIPYMLNNYPYRMYGTSEQGARGDGTIIVPNLTFEITGDGNQFEAPRQLFREMQATKYLRFDTYDPGVLVYSYRIPVAYPQGVNKVESLTPMTFRAEIEFVATTVYWDDLDTTNEVVGVI